MSLASPSPRWMRIAVWSLFALGALMLSASLTWGQATPAPHDHAHHGHAAEAVPAAGASPGFLDWATQVYVPRSECMFQQPDVIWTHVISDAVIALSYFSIPVALVYFVRRRDDLSFNWVFYFFATFILACGTTHVFSILAVWYPLYRLDGWVKVVTAIASVGTAAVLWPMIPKLLSIPSRAQLHEANQRLEEEIDRTRVAEKELRAMRDQLEDRVRARTAELEQANARLHHEVAQRMQAEAERERLLESERTARSDAERANRMKDDFLATVSHELRTPINSILGWTHVMRTHAMQGPEFEEALEVIERNTRVQARLIDDLLDMSRIVSGKLELSLQNVRLDSVIDAAIETIKSSAVAKGIQIEGPLGDTPGEIEGDPQRLQQVVWNLLANSVKFTPPGGHIKVHTRRVDGFMEIVVSDDGQGIRPDLLRFVFDRFRQGDSSITRRHGGLGLGLSIVKNVVELHGGTVAAFSEGEGKGARFTVRLPLGSLASASDLPASHAPANLSQRKPFEVSLSGISVLVVDDEPDARTLARRLLEEHGAEVVVAGSAQEAMDALDRKLPSIIVSDIGMPEEDGYSLIRRIRKLSPERGGRLPAIALTAFARAEDRVNSLLGGFQAHLSKPVDIREFLVTVANLADMGRQA